MTFDKIDDYFILAFGVWFMAKAILFATTWLVSRKLMEGKSRTRLSSAQHMLFFGLALVGAAMGPAFLLSYFSGTGVMASDPRIEPPWITNVIRIVLLIGLAIVTIAGGRSFIAQYKRYHGIEDALHVTLEEGQVVPIMIDGTVTGTIEQTATNVEEVRNRVERIEHKIDKEEA